MYLRDGIVRGLEAIGESAIDVGVTIGMGLNIDGSLSRVIPGGGTSFEVEDIEEVERGPRGGTAAGAEVLICSGSDNRLAY